MTQDFRSPLSKARGLGSAGEGAHHWWLQRVTAIALIPLTLWFMASAVMLAGKPRSAVFTWLNCPVSAVLMILFLFTAFYHASLGVQVVIEDYISNKMWRKLAILTEKFFCIALGTTCVYAVLRISFGG
jgi:succinate dehydrogenase / fumarate reductase membrane anchor subunit